MSLAFPRMFTRGQKLEDADVYGELFVWPEGPFQYTIRVRSRNLRSAASVNAAFVLFDSARTPLGTYGMAAGEALSCLAAGASFQSREAASVLCGSIPKDKIEKTASVALVFRARDEAVDPANAIGHASEGVDLALCPVPD